jgi:SAM-dependent MidA family methyltransferase
MARKLREYYSSPGEKFGSRGDFFTAPELDSSFGEAIAEFVAPLLLNFEKPLILELGAGRGLLARDILSHFSRKHRDLYENIEYRIYDFSPPLVEVQRRVLEGFPVVWTQEIEPFEGVVLANEFFDALPVHVVRGGKELFINGSGEEVWLPVSNPQIKEFLSRMGYGTSDQRIEVPLDALKFLEDLSLKLGKGYILIIDYGYTSDELGRYPEGTLMGYKKHRAVSDIISEEMMDITAHVNFSALMEYAEEFGLEVSFFDSQRNFLASIPLFMERLQSLAFDESPESIERLSRLKTLLISMGERFKVLMLSKGF